MPIATLCRGMPSIVLLFVAAGFAFLLAELLLMGHTEGTQLVAVAAAMLGLALSLVALVRRPRLRVVVMALFGLLAISGVYGAFEHQEVRGERQPEVAAAFQAVGITPPGARPAASDADAPASDEAGETAEHREGTREGAASDVVAKALHSFANNPPALSPLALSGLATLGILALLTAEVCGQAPGTRVVAQPASDKGW